LIQGANVIPRITPPISLPSSSQSQNLPSKPKNNLGDIDEAIDKLFSF
jgi:hypothetical protein